MKLSCPGQAVVGGVLLLGLAMSGCAGGGGDVAPVAEPGWGDAETSDPWPELETMEEVRHFLDPIGPNPAGVDTFTFDWRSRSGPTLEGPPLDWSDRFVEDLELTLSEDWDPFSDLTSNLVLTGSVVGTTTGPPDGFWRAGVYYNAGLEDGSWLSVGLYGGEGVGGSPVGSGTDFGMDVHVRVNLAVQDNGNRSAWLVGLRRGFYRWGGGGQVEYGSGYGGLAVDLPLGERTFLSVQGILGLRWSEYPLEDLALEAGVDLGIVIPLSGPDNGD